MAQPQVKFDEKAHRYTLGRLVLPSVTQVIPDALAGADPEDVAAGGLRGKLVHELTAALDLGLADKLIEFDDPMLKPYFAAYLKFLIEKKPKIVAVEWRSFHPQYLFAGQLDRIYEFESGLALTDLKTAATIMPEAALQTAAYEKLAELAGYKIKKRFTLQLRKDGKYKLHEWREKTDFGVFMSLLNYHRWKMSHRPKTPDNFDDMRGLNVY